MYRRAPRALCAVMAATLLLFTRPSQAAPADVFSIAAPTLGSQLPKSEAIEQTSASVSTQTGAFKYGYPIEVPPGRNGAEPHLSLAYSSQAAIYGGIGAGWTLDIPIVREDTSLGRLKTHYALASGGDARSDDRFYSSMAGDRPLVAVTEPSTTAPSVYATYRAQNDSRYTRYERMESAYPFRWRALGTDGTIYIFGGSSANCPGVVSDGYAPLTQTSDGFGNTVDYYYSMANGECRISNINYGANVAAGIVDYATVSFSWAASTACSGIYPGSQVDYRSGTEIVTGTAQLQSIVATTSSPGASSADHTRQIALTYEDTESCFDASRPSSPVRLLHSIQESAWGIDSPRVDLHPVVFAYGASSAAFDTSTMTSAPWALADDSGQSATYNESSTLSWGFRFADDRWPTLESAMIDMDGDGLLDRVVIGTGTDASGAATCRAIWQQNLGLQPNGHIGFAGTTHSIDLPHLKWSDGAPTMGSGDSCSLNGQQTQYSNTAPGNGESTYLAYRWIDLDGDGLTDLVTGIYASSERYLPDKTGEPAGPFGAWPSCSGASSTCNDVSASCLHDIYTCNAGTCTRSDLAEASCVASASGSACGQQMVDPAVPQCCGGATPPPARVAYTHCDNGHYPWFFYKNLGDGQLSTTPVITYSPMPLESEQSNSSLAQGGYATSTNALTDFDGDHIPDAIIKESSSDATATLTPFQWVVFRGDGNGGFDPQGYIVLTREDAAINFSEQLDGAAEHDFYTVGALQDVNGDGLLDQWQSNGTDPLNVAMNDGTNFRTVGSPGDGEVNLPASIVRMGTTDSSSTYDENLAAGGPVPVSGDRWSRDFMADIDGDGRTDIINAPDSTSALSPSSLSVHLDTGGSFTSSALAFPSSLSIDFRPHVVATGVHLDQTMIWEEVSNYVDLDGDGLAEYVSCDGAVAGAQCTRAFHDTSAGPPRVMISVDNGMGATTSIIYGTMHSSAVTQDATATGRDADPGTRWVVQSTTTREEFAATTSTTSYHYTHPRYLPDDVGLFAFRGFDEVVTMTPTLAQTVQRFSYFPDWSGRLATTLVIAAEDPSSVRSIEATTYAQFDILGTALQLFLPTKNESWTCANGQTEATCEAAAPAHLAKSYTYSAYPSGTAQALLVQSAVLEQTGPTLVDGDRETDTTFTLVDDADSYRLRAYDTLFKSDVGGTMVTYGRKRQTWDSNNLTKSTDEVWVDDIDAHRSITRYGYDTQTGNLTGRWKPVQNAAGGPGASYDYDTRKLFVATETSEPDAQGQHIVYNYTYEYGTGKKLETDGPNTRTCTVSCTTDATHPVKDVKKIRVDGLGREIETWQTTSDDGNTYTLYQFDSTAYQDSVVFPNSPLSVTTRHRMDITDDAPWVQEQKAFDGSGRIMRDTLYAQGAAAADKVTTYHFTNSGFLGSVTEPDPTANDTSTVTYTYDYDSLGRPTAIRRPDSTVLASRSGTDMSYDGVSTTVTEVVGAAGGTPAATRSISDARKRLVEIDERTRITPSETWATTTYTYTPDDKVRMITDADAHIVAVTYDQGGRRTQVQREGRAWLYSYDANGNLTSERVPGSTGPVTDALYTTTIAYDALDRPVSRILGQRGLSSADQALFGTGSESITWDYGGNHMGYQRYWQSYAPGSSTATVTMDVYNSDQGQRVNTNETLNLAGASIPSMTRQFYQNYYLFGGVRVTYYRDYVGGSNMSSSQAFYDARGLPTKLTLSRPGSSTISIGVQTRNVAGLVTKRRTDTAGAMTFAESNWTYDKLGRISEQVVQTGPGPTQLAQQDVAYFGNDDISQTTQYLGTTSRLYSYQYDPRHQLEQASDASSAFVVNYGYDSAGSLSHVDETSFGGAGTNLVPRSVNYHYDAAIPSQLTSLDNTGDSSAMISYEYDASGNEIQRYDAATHAQEDFTFDAHDQLRRVVKSTNGAVQSSELYWYDNVGNRSAVLKRNGAGTNTDLVWFLGGTEAHYDGTGILVDVISYLGEGTPVARVDRTSNTATTIDYLFYGLDSNLLATTDESGTTTSAITYAPSGEILETRSTGAAFDESAHPRMMNDKYEDQIDGLYYYGARYYDRTSMLWTQPDPTYVIAPDTALKEPRRMLTYTMDLNNTLRYTDPDGRDPASSPMTGPVVAILRSFVSDSTEQRAVDLVRQGVTQAMSSNGRIGSIISQVRRVPVCDCSNLTSSNVPPDGRAITSIHIGVVDSGDEWKNVPAALYLLRGNGASQSWNIAVGQIFDHLTHPGALAWTMPVVGGLINVAPIQQMIDGQKPFMLDWASNYLAPHEIGHFFNQKHPEDAHPSVKNPPAEEMTNGFVPEDWLKAKQPGFTLDELSDMREQLTRPKDDSAENH
jgi:RHS repeat-associated protein